MKYIFLALLFFILAVGLSVYLWVDVYLANKRGAE